MGAELGKQLEDKVVILGRTSKDQYTNTCKLDYLFKRLSPKGRHIKSSSSRSI